MRNLVVLGVITTRVLVGGLAVADDESDRRDLLQETNRKLESMASELSGFESDSDVGDLDDALSYARELRDVVSKLERVKGSDSQANDIVSRYPGYIDQFREAARYLKRVKEGQRRADGAADRCRNDEANLQQLIRNYLGRPDDADEATSKLPDKARDYQRTWQPFLEEWRRNDSELANAASYARFSVNDGKWSYVSSNMSNANNAMHTYWRERFAAAERACTRLTLGERHPDIEKALDDLAKYTGNVKGTVTQLKKDYNAWLREVRKLREFSERDRDEIRAIMCKAGEYEMPRRVAEVADRWANQISSVYGTTLGLADRLKSRAIDDKLKKYKGPREVYDGLMANLANLEKLKNFELQGANNPRIRTKLEWGKKRHEDLQSSCTYSELKISSGDCDNKVRPGSGCRADCVKVSSGTCNIIEIKPNSDDAKNEGRTQVNAYEDGLARWYKRDKKDLFKDYSNISGCENSDKTALNIRSEVITYELCTSSVKNELGEEIRDASSDLSENAE